MLERYRRSTTVSFKISDRRKSIAAYPCSRKIIRQYFERLFIDVVLASLPSNCSREQHLRTICDKGLDESFGACSRQTLGNLKALN
jgi:hypothetical protein